MATSNAQLTKLAIGITAVAALAAMTGSLSAGASAPNAPAQASTTDNTQTTHTGVFGFRGSEDQGEGEQSGNANTDAGRETQSQRSPRFANPGTGRSSSGAHTRSRHS